MIRTQISLDKSEYDLARKEAAALGISVAELPDSPDTVRQTLSFSRRRRSMDEVCRLRLERQSEIQPID